MAKSRNPVPAPARKTPPTNAPRSPFSGKTGSAARPPQAGNAKFKPQSKPDAGPRGAFSKPPREKSAPARQPSREQARPHARPAAAIAFGAQISRRASERLRNGHLWVYATDIEAIDIGPGEAPALLPVADNRGLLLGTALYSPASQIALRVVAREALSHPQWLALLATRLRTALQRRKHLLNGQTNACRLCYSEADNLPGLVIDQYAGVVVVQLLAKGLDNPETRAVCARVLSEELLSSTGPLTIWERPDPRIRELEGLSAPSPAPLFASHPDAPQSETLFRLNGLSFHFDANSGQKTGAFLDQRENYRAAANWAQARGAKKALDVCTYQGGFALHLSRVCQQVTGVDSSRASLEVAERNLTANQENPGAPEPALSPSKGLASALGETKVDWVEADAFELLRAWSELPEHSDYDLIVLDPPAFAKSKRAVEGALRGYKELNLRALKMIRPGGLLVTCSCSHHVTWTDLEGAVASAALDTNRRVTLLERRGAAQDHPVVLNLPETEYLKCLICQVD